MKIKKVGKGFSIDSDLLPFLRNDKTLIRDINVFLRQRYLFFISQKNQEDDNMINFNKALKNKITEIREKFDEMEFLLKQAKLSSDGKEKLPRGTFRCCYCDVIHEGSPIGNEKEKYCRECFKLLPKEKIIKILKE